MLAARFAATLSALGPFAPRPHLAIALSGGADSLALTLLAEDWVRAHGGRITTLTVDHALRPESRHEAEEVAGWMRARGIAHHILTPEHIPHSNNLQETARAWRYAALADFCRAEGILHCLIAHNAGDNRETVAHNLARGETADGASGMRSAHVLHGVRFLRPLLTTERTELEAFLHAHNTPWIDDPSNQNPRFARVRMRQALLNDAARVAQLDAVIHRQAAARRTRDEALAQASATCVTLSPLGFADINVEAWRMLEPTLRSQLLADSITTIGGHTNRPRAHDTHRLVETTLSPDMRKRTLGQCEITRTGDLLRIARETARVEPPITLSGEGKVQWDGRFFIDHRLPAHTSLTLRALGMDGRKQLGQKNLPLSTPSLWHLDELLFVPHIGMPQEQLHAVTIGFTPAKPLAAAPFW